MLFVVVVHCSELFVCVWVRVVELSRSKFGGCCPAAANDDSFKSLTSSQGDGEIAMFFLSSNLKGT